MAAVAAIGAAASGLGIVTGAKDLVELALAIKDSIDKVRDNKQDQKRLANGLVQELLQLQRLIEERDTLVSIPQLDFALSGLKTRLQELLRQCRHVFTKKRGLAHVGDVLIAWKDRDAIARQIVELKETVNKYHRDFQTAGIARTEQAVHVSSDSHRLHLTQMEERIIAALKQQKSNSLVLADESTVARYTRDRIRLMAKLATFDSNGRVTVYKGQERKNGTVVLVKQYEGGSSATREQRFMTDLEFYENNWRPFLLQLVGASRATEKVPFQVYDAPSGDIESFGDWYNRTLRTYLVEGIRGLYDMRTSIKELIEFQMDESVSCKRLLWDCMVHVEDNGQGRKWNLVYAGDIESRAPEITSAADAYKGLPFSELDRLVDSFCHAAGTWTDDRRRLDEVLNFESGVQNSVATIFATLWKLGWVEQVWKELCAQVPVDLGDIGYINKNGDFQTVANIHHEMISIRGRKAVELREWDSTTEGISISPPLKIPDRSCVRHQLEIIHGQPQDIRSRLRHKDLDSDHAWRSLQKCASGIIARNALTVQPHDLLIIIDSRAQIDICVTFGSPESDVVVVVDDFPSKPHDTLVGTTEIRPYFTKAVEKASPGKPEHNIPQTVFIFTQVVGGGTKASRLPRIRASFNPEPEWLESEDAWREEVGRETKDGFELEWCRKTVMDYLQLQVGRALPYITEADEA